MMEKQKISNKDNKHLYEIGLVGPISSSEEINHLYSEQHWNAVRDIIDASFIMDEDPKVTYKSDLVSVSTESDMIQKSIVTNLAKQELVICDVSGNNPNVLFELGLRLAFNKNVIIIKDDITNINFDITVVEHLIYPSDLNYSQIVEFQNKLINRIKKYRKGEIKKSFLDSFADIKVDNTLPEVNEQWTDSISRQIDKLDNKVENLVSVNLEKKTDYNKSINNFTNKRLDTAVKKIILENLPKLSPEIFYVNPKDSDYNLINLELIDKYGIMLHNSLTLKNSVDKVLSNMKPEEDIPDVFK